MTTSVLRHEAKPTGLIELSTLRGRVEESARKLAAATAVPARLRTAIRGIVEDVLVAGEALLSERDPYLVAGLQSGALTMLLALDGPDRRRLRVGLEQIRQALRDMQESLPVAEDRSAVDIARWLADSLDVPQADLARLVGVSPRTFQRWLAAAEGVEPRSDDARRLRLVARAAAHLRHALTGPGVVRWFQRPHPRLEGRSPSEILDEHDAAHLVTRLAASVRTSAAA